MKRADVRAHVPYKMTHVGGVAVVLEERLWGRRRYRNSVPERLPEGITAAERSDYQTIGFPALMAVPATIPNPDYVADMSERERLRQEYEAAGNRWGWSDDPRYKPTLPHPVHRDQAQPFLLEPRSIECSVAEHEERLALQRQAEDKARRERLERYSARRARLAALEAAGLTFSEQQRADLTSEGGRFTGPPGSCRVDLDWLEGVAARLSAVPNVVIVGDTDSLDRMLDAALAESGRDGDAELG